MPIYYVAYDWLALLGHLSPPLVCFSLCTKDSMAVEPSTSSIDFILFLKCSKITPFLRLIRQSVRTAQLDFWRLHKMRTCALKILPNIILDPKKVEMASILKA
jgi:hypothetical protein